MNLTQIAEQRQEDIITKQNELSELLDQFKEVVMPLIKEIHTKSSQLNKQVDYTMVEMGNNRKLEVDMQHFIELGTDLAQADKIELFDTMNDVLGARRVHKDILRGLGANPNMINSWFSGNTETLGSLGSSRIPKLKASKKAQELSTYVLSHGNVINTTVAIKKSFAEDNLNRMYTLKTPSKSAQGKTLNKMLNNIKKQESKFIGFIKEGQNG